MPPPANNLAGVQPIAEEASSTLQDAGADQDDVTDPLIETDVASGAYPEPATTQFIEYVPRIWYGEPPIAHFVEHVHRIWYGDLQHLSYDYRWRQMHAIPADAIPIRTQRKLHAPSSHYDDNDDGSDDSMDDDAQADPAAHWNPSDGLFPYDEPTAVDDHNVPASNANTVDDTEATQAAKLKARVQRIWHGDLCHLSYDYRWRQMQAARANAAPAQLAQDAQVESKLPTSTGYRHHHQNAALHDVHAATAQAEPPTTAALSGGQSPARPARLLPTPLLPTRIPLPRFRTSALRPVQASANVGDQVDHAAATKATSAADTQPGATTQPAANKSPAADTKPAPAAHLQRHRQRQRQHRYHLAELRARLQNVRSRLFDFRTSPSFLQRVADAKQRRQTAASASAAS
ncbi:hypothetical protein PHYBOEH_000274 [Phytophthora boehmeriae]|uniref:Uncharacterized protein n=1 Tax=Phytophthora boehmeriae TaxID=109152 RepID=A0A8T1WVV0_9STRA|nr:hypothetical protein PHYBOEH_000274 [Phytophthora boehmeriae]